MANHWSNWSASVKAVPAQVLYPTTETEVQDIVRKANSEGRSIRVVGAGHSFTPLVQTDSTILSLDKLSGLISADKDQLQATVWAGTRLKALGEILHSQGMAMENLGDIDVQSIAGALSTGTHGTGIELGTLSTQLRAITLVTATGELLTLTPEDERFPAAQVSLGVLGIITRLTIQLVPSYKLTYTSGKATLPEVLADLDRWKTQHRNFEFYFFPFTQTVQTKVMDITDDAPKKGGIGKWMNDILLENGLFWVLSRISRHIPGTYKGVSKISAWGISSGSTTSWSHQVFATKRLVKFQEMEYNIPADRFKEAMKEIEETIRVIDFRVHFPIECRWVKADDIWLSPAHGRDSAYIAVHMYKGMPHKEYFGAIEGIMKKYGGRPHWGKMHTLSSADLAERYPKFKDFQDLRREMDPKGTFLNGYLRDLFEPETSA